MRKIILVLGFVCCAGSDAFAQTTAQIEYWRALVATEPLQTISKDLAAPDVQVWPFIPSSYAAQLLPDDRKRNAVASIQLAEEMLGK